MLLHWEPKGLRGLIGIYWNISMQLYLNVGSTSQSTLVKLVLIVEKRLFTLSPSLCGDYTLPSRHLHHPLSYTQVLSSRGPALTRVLCAPAPASAQDTVAIYPEHLRSSVDNVHCLICLIPARIWLERFWSARHSLPFHFSSSPNDTTPCRRRRGNIPPSLTQRLVFDELLCVSQQTQTYTRWCFNVGQASSAVVQHWDVPFLLVSCNPPVVAQIQNVMRVSRSSWHPSNNVFAPRYDFATHFVYCIYYFKFLFLSLSCSEAWITVALLIAFCICVRNGYC